jgi:hypothetical protein
MAASYLPAVVRAKYVSDYLLDVTFDDGTRKLIDFSQWLKGPVFKPLREKGFFKRFFIASATVVWPNGADIAPETLYAAEDVRKRQRTVSKR